MDTGQLQIDEPPTTINTDMLQEQPPVDEPIQALQAVEQQPQEADISVNPNETTLIANEEDAFALEPLDVSGQFLLPKELCCIVINLNYS